MNRPFKYYFVSILATFFLILHLSDDKSTNEKFTKSKFFPSDHEMIKRTFPFFDYDKDAYKDAINEFKELKELQKQSNLIPFYDLEFVGPTNIGGRVVDIEFNPINPTIVYAAAATGGVFKSEDTGLNWFPIFDDQPNLSIGDIGIDPNNPDVIYVGTGEANGGHNNFPGLGIYKSIDGGNSWEFKGLDSTVSIGRIVVDPSNSNRIFVAAVGSYFSPNPQRGIYLSEDAGNTWGKSLFISDTTGAIDLVINPSNPDIIFAAMWERVRRPVFRSGTHLYGPSGGIFKSNDGGITWEKLGSLNGLPDPAVRRIGRIGLTITQSKPSVLYALYNDGTTPFGLYKTIDEGENWTEMDTTFTGSGNFSWYFGQVRVHPTIAERVFVLDVALLRSSQSGSNWDFSYGYSGPSQLHVDHHALAFHPDNPNYLISGNDGGINISEDGGLTWSTPANLPITQFYEIGLDENNPERFYGGTQDNNTIRTLSGSLNDWTRIWGGDGFYVIVDPNNPDIIYAESQFGYLVKSTDGGNSFFYALNGIDDEEPTNWSTPVVMDPNNSNILYYGTHSLYRTENGTSSWEKVSPKLTDHSDERRLGTITTIAVAQTNSNVIYVGTDDSYIWVSDNVGGSWKIISDDLPFRWITRVAVDPNDEKIVYATFSGLKWRDPEPRVFRSTDMGITWQNISGGLPDAPVNAFAIDNNNSDILYIGNDIGAFVSHNTGNTWNILSESLPIVVVNDMKIHPTENYLAIGTHGRGMYKIDLNQLVGQRDEIQVSENIELFQNYPNPFNPATTIKYRISAHNFDVNSPKKVKIVIYDDLGKEITTLVNKKQNPGNYEVIFNGNSYASGVYYYTIIVDNYTKSRKMILLK